MAIGGIKPPDIPNPLQALKGDDNKATTSPFYHAELAKENTAPNEEALRLPSNWEFLQKDGIDGKRWNKSYPYQLLTVKPDANGKYKIQETFTLPIPPQAMSITTPFAINTIVTLGGIVEEHNGAPIRMISFQGTTGVQPLKGIPDGASLGRANLLEGVFAGTVNAVNTLVTRTKTLIGKPDDNTRNLVSEADEDLLKSTGYYQFRLLQKFLESYVQRKRVAANEQLRLALAIWKDQSIYLVTPMVFEVRRDAGSPWEYLYSLQFKAWRRVKVNGGGPKEAEAFKPITRDANAFAQALNKLQEARRVLQGARDVLSAVKGDVDRLLFEPLREVVLFCKDAIGVATTAADLPSSIASSMKSAVLEAQASFSSLAGVSDLSISSSKAETGAGSLSSSSSALTGAEPANAIFDKPEENFEAMEKIKPSELNISPAIQKKILEEKRRIRELGRLDFEKARDQFVEFQADFADAVGAGSDSYNRTYDRPTVVANKTPTQDDYDALFALNQVILEMNRLAASSDVDQSLSTIEAVAGMASASGIAFTIPTSKYAVPFPYGITLEQLAAQYLGDPNRWHEIVALNGLRQPYIDEVGFDLPLLVNGIENQITVSDASNLYVGQPVWISATNTSRTKRRITKIERVAGTAILTLDGDPDLDRFSTLAQASLHAFLPDTVNSQMLIYIPSDEEPEEEDFRTKSIPGVDEFDQLINVGGIDLLLTQNGDLAITPDGDCRLAIGLTNLVQRVRTALGTPKGSLIHHPEYGLGIVPGISTADVDATQLLTSLQDMFRNEPAFTGVSSVAISKSGPGLRIAMSVGIAGANQTIPVTVDIRR
jgi:hypothetical protein